MLRATAKALMPTNLPTLVLWASEVDRATTHAPRSLHKVARFLSLLPTAIMWVVHSSLTPLVCKTMAGRGRQVWAIAEPLVATSREPTTILQLISWLQKSVSTQIMPFRSSLMVLPPTVRNKGLRRKRLIGWPIHTTITPTGAIKEDKCATAA